MEGFKVGNEAGFLSVSHDSLIFCVDERSQVLNLNLKVMICEAISGLHMNILKITIYLRFLVWKAF